MSIDTSTLAGRIKASIKDAGLTQRHIAAKIGIRESAVSAYTQGASEPSATGFKVISDECGVTIDWLITGHGDKRRPASSNPAIESVVRESADHWNKLDSPPSDFEVRIVGMLRRLPQDTRQRFLDLITSAYFDEMESG